MYLPFTRLLSRHYNNTIYSPLVCVTALAPLFLTFFLYSYFSSLSLSLRLSKTLYKPLQDERERRKRRFIKSQRSHTHTEKQARQGTRTSYSHDENKFSILWIFSSSLAGLYFSLGENEFLTLSLEYEMVAAGEPADTDDSWG